MVFSEALKDALGTFRAASSSSSSSSLLTIFAASLFYTVYLDPTMGSGAIKIYASFLRRCFFSSSSGLSGLVPFFVGGLVPFFIWCRVFVGCRLLFAERVVSATSIAQSTLSDQGERIDSCYIHCRIDSKK